MMNSGAVTVYLGLGSNLGERKENLNLALNFLSERMKIEKLSLVYDTAPMYEPNQPRFLNVACRVSTRLPATALLHMVKGIEAKLGRVPVSAPRPIDVDILFYGDQVVDTPPQLIIPHPRIAERAFVLIPLADIAPDLVHPVLKKTVKELLDAVGGKEGVVKWEEPAKEES
ncbi:MAG: 2-amino-4-hydroxy-6-hydroxymethyldihydropteridine diphosphokinase [Dehalococcoidia bacterium]|nr:2-amino-4-hydroxy-6-hydroxymethyldihydropteridine diphosphokinase [Dehalococcoidia bacterium]